VPDTCDPSLALRQIVAADKAGLDLSVGGHDHPYQGRFFDTWTLPAFAAARTDHIRLMTDVANLPLVHPRCCQGGGVA
jgi:alkanesulfonate monooxygenase SsuD/methylene tetrahydromethanopterin reductase-like flavin-dependent oxidoreductase (luciferase family)